MADRTIVFPSDHPYYPGKELVVPESATQEEIDAQIDELSKPSEKPSVAADVAKASAVAPVKAGIGMLGSLGDVQKLLDSFAANNPAVNQAKLAEMRGNVLNRNIPTSTGIRKKVEGVTGPLYDPQTSPGKIAGAAVEGATGAALTGGRNLIEGGLRGVLPRLGAYGAAPGAVGETVRQQTEGYKFPEWVPGVGGKDISPYASSLAALFTPTPLRKAVTPNTLNNPVRQQQYETAVRESGGEFTPTAGQLFQDPKQVNRELAARRNINDQQSAAITQTITRHAGDPTTDITSSIPGNWVDRNLTRTGRNFDNLEQTTHIQAPGNPTLRGGGMSYAYPDLIDIARRRPQDVPGILNTIERTSARLTPHATALPEEQIHSALFNSIGTGRLTGEEYRRLRTNLHTAAEGAGAPESAHAYRQVANALDNAMSRTNPAWGQSWNQARREYANTLVGQELAAGKQGKTRFSSDEIARATRKVMGKVPYVRGELENSPFTWAAGAFPPLKKSKVPEEPSVIQRAASRIPLGQTALAHGKVLGAALGGYGGAKAAQYLGADPVPMLEAGLSAGILGSILGEKARGATRLSPYAMNPVVQWHKKNQILPYDRNAVNRAAIVQGLMAGQRSSQQNQ